MSKVAESEGYGGTICHLHLTVHIYMQADTTQKVWKIDPSNMGKVAESEGYGGIIYAIAFDGTYLYAGGGTTQRFGRLTRQIWVK